MNPILCHILKKEKATHDVSLVTLEADAVFDFTAGQYALLSFEKESNGFIRPYSIGSKPNSKTLEFHFKDSHTAGGFSHRIMTEKNSGDAVYVHDIKGSMILPAQATRPILMIAGGVGIAPFKAMIESSSADTHSFTVFWGCNKAEEFYKKEFLDKPSVKKHLCLVDEEKQGFYHGLVSDAVLSHFDTVSDYDVYLSGPLSMFSHTVDLLKERGLSKKNLFCDYMFDF